MNRLNEEHKYTLVKKLILEVYINSSLNTVDKVGIL